MTDSTTTPALDLARAIEWMEHTARVFAGSVHGRKAAEHLEAVRSLREEVAKLKAAPLEWTKEKPKVSGYYWHRTENHLEPEIDLFWIGNGGLVRWPSSHIKNIENFEWAGPIPPPGANPTKGEG